MDRATSRNFGSRTPMTEAAAALPTRTTTQREAYSRVPCRYFSSPKGYFILSSTSILRRFSCYKGKECRFSHDIAPQDALSNTSTDMPDQFSSPRSDTPSSSPADPPTVPTHVCGICFEMPKKYGLLANCSHVFCLCLSHRRIILTYSLYSQMEKQRRKVRRDITRRVFPYYCTWS
jgi:hypothetical protein